MRIAVGFKGVRETVLRTDGAPVTVRIAAPLVTLPDTACMCELAEPSPVFCAMPEPFVNGLPSEVHAMGAVKGLLNWSNAEAVNAKAWPGATVTEGGTIEMWSR